MMNFIEPIKSALSIDFTKTRNDSVSSRWNRLLGSKILLMVTIITAWCWYKDGMECNIFGGYNEITEAFTDNSCWMNGLYVYTELIRHRLTHEFGVPDDISQIGIRKSGDTFAECQPIGTTCTHMTKQTFTTFQWVPFFILACSVALQFPYGVFKWCYDRTSHLKQCVDKSFAKDIFLVHFESEAPFSPVEWMCSLCNIIVECLYVSINLALLYITASVLGEGFINYVPAMLSFDEWQNRTTYGPGRYPAPSDFLFPEVGLCDSHSKKSDILKTTHDKITIVCEMSPHAIYKHCFVVVWLVLVTGLVVSSVGVLIASFRLIQCCFTCNRKGFTLRQLRIYEAVKEQDLKKFYEINRLLTARSARSAHPDSQVELILDSYKTRYGLPYKKAEVQL